MSFYYALCCCKMKSFSFIAVLVFCSFSREVSSRKHEYKVNQTKIVGGFKVNIRDVPYQVYLLIQKEFYYFYCGGSIINERYVLTAAHCLKDTTKVFIRAGSTDMESGGRQYVSTTYKIHPLYNEKAIDYDVGIIRISKKIVLDGKYTAAVKLPAMTNKSRLPTGTQLLVTGWGRTSENSITSSNLMAVKVPTVSQIECAKVYGGITSRMLCAGIKKGGKDSCQGDSGGPAVTTASRIQVGIVSFGLGCARPGTPGVYTNLCHKSIRLWINYLTGV